MTRARSIRSALAVPAALLLALGGALIATASASAAPGDPVVITSPQAGATTDTFVVEFTGTGSDEASVELTVATDPDLTAVATVGTDGAWRTTITFPETAGRSQTVTATQVIDPSVTPTTASVTFDLPTPPVEPIPFELTAPEEGAQYDTRLVPVAGTNFPGADVSVIVEGEEFPWGSADENGGFDFTLFLPYSYGELITATIVVRNPVGSVIEERITRTFTLRAPIPAPLITSPTTGTTITGDTVVFRGTGRPGDTARFRFLPDEATAAANPQLGTDAGLPSAVVGADGTFAVSVTLPFGTYTAQAAFYETSDSSFDAEPLSELSEPVTFTLAAAAPAGTELADTGPGSTGLVGPAAALLAVGLLLVIASRRRTARAVSAQ